METRLTFDPAALDQRGYATIPALLDANECAAIARLYEEPARFRSRIIMSRHGFGRGEYQYFAYPLPDVVRSLRARLYQLAVPVANRWQEQLRSPVRFPESHDEFVQVCRKSGQFRPTPLLLRYGPGDFNCLHQDLYGENVFPLQMAVLLSQPEVDFAGGELALTEQRPRQQSRVDVVPLNQGDAVVFAVNERPVQGTRGVYRVKMRHGVSVIRRGQRHTLGIICHDAA